jgi:ribosomal protein S18 acetylase RimI-like enzyme
MSTLRRITNAEFATWLTQAVAAYAADKVTSGAWSRANALDRSRKEHDALLPEGKDTPDHHLFSIVDASGAPVGTLWFAVEHRGDTRVAYVYNVVVLPEHRRQGFALRAFAALEDEVQRMGLAGIALHVFEHNTAAQALYRKLGFRPRDFNLFKPVGPSTA